MTDISISQFMASVYLKITGKTINKPDFAQMILTNGGHDMSALSLEDIIALYDEKFSGENEEVTWAFDETMYFYHYTDSPEDLCCAIFTLVILCDAASKDERDFFTQFNKIITTYNWIYQRIKEETALELFYMYFYRNNTAHVCKDLCLQFIKYKQSQN